MSPSPSLLHHHHNHHHQPRNHRRAPLLFLPPAACLHHCHPAPAGLTRPCRPSHATPPTTRQSRPDHTLIIHHQACHHSYPDSASRACRQQHCANRSDHDSEPTHQYTLSSLERIAQRISLCTFHQHSHPSHEA
ncbi:hypothetical protein Micbo1qcDRAFT_20741 [Microdochium bolleyi]|uniref:Uncharacterized protein n=1 Tax=Microdochium bolleyi TaxID=196109 RepID=A0A136IRP2_9PEZI|nr:hypothetical protein Micbo1qcDRAFT_20741 [Microdochium bolleyi]